MKKIIFAAVLALPSSPCRRWLCLVANAPPFPQVMSGLKWTSTVTKKVFSNPKWASVNTG
ncbi:hypothetical protein [Kluyvera genomosp. 2]|uniref:hypothetical protein n=1 Tax=Kluyvera genomosp. 2 TaxID=2774054 RepID=UPI001CC7F329|nr:hypothetical protein [Kluyvera genomosp. 2]